MGLAFWLALFSLVPAGLLAAPVAPPEKKGIATGKLPIEIRSDRLKVVHREGKIVFTGKVVAKRGDVTIHAKSLSVFYEVGEEKQGGNPGTGEIKSITALGDVRIVQGDRLATGQRADYYETEQKIVLTGSPRIWQGKSFVRGKRIVVYLQEERSEVEGDDEEPVRATIHPKERPEKSGPNN